MKKWGLLLMCICWSLGINAQHNMEIVKETIMDGMESFASRLDYLYTEDKKEQADIYVVNRRFGGEYFSYNGRAYKNLGDWLQKFYYLQLKEGEVNHVVTVNQKTVKKIGTVKDSRCYQFEATLTRSVAYEEDMFIADEPVTIEVEVDVNGGVRILGIKGNWAIKRIAPEYRWVYELEVNNVPSNIDKLGGKYIADVISKARLLKSYGGQKESYVDEVNVQAYYIDENDKEYKVKDGKYDLYFTKNYYSYGKTHNVRFRQEIVAKGKDFYVSQGNYPQTFEKNVYQEKGPKNIEIFDFDEYDAPYMEANFHYGLKNTFGLSIAGPFDDSRFTLGLYTAMCKNRISQLPKIVTEYYYNRVGMTTNLGTTVIVDGNGQSIQVEECTEKIIDIIYPSKRHYSNELDPDGEAKYKKAYSYTMAVAGMFVNNWWHLDLGLGVARTQDTYEMDNAYMMEVIEKTYTLNGVTKTETERRLERMGFSFLYKDYAKYHFAMRPSMNFYIPLADKSVFLKLGVGYTYVPTDTDADNVDFSIGCAINY